MDNIEQAEDDYEKFYKNVSIPLEGSLSLKDVEGQDGADFVVKEQETCNDEEEIDTEELISTLSSACLGDDDDEDTDEDDNQTPFEKLSRKMMDITPERSGNVLKRVITQGTGKVVEEGHKVVLHFSAYLEYSDEPYDSSRLRKSYEKFVLGRGEVIPGMDLAVSTMRRGERSQFLIQSCYAFGKMGCPPRIPGDANILMDIELHDFSHSNIVEEFYDLPEYERKQASFEKILHVVKIAREEGSKFYEQKQFKKAQEKYLKAQRTLDKVHMKDEKDEEAMKAELLKLCLNIGLVSLKLGQPARTIHNCKRALEIQRNNIRAFYRMGQAFLDLDDFDQSERYLKKVLAIDPSNDHAKDALLRLAKRKRELHLFETDLYSKMFKDLNNVGEKTTSDDKTEVACSLELKKQIKQKLKSYKESSGHVDPLFLQTNNMAPSEAQYMQVAAKEMGLDVRLMEKGNEKCLKISIPDGSGDA